ncbi:PREDICTED: zinc finger protein 839 isoform X2 [Chinchilla lanigera]|uniref:zinc finger protein 839 isoform X2 n=1 Tax=Chinchilla lanigera TaxID=34839 RepID=UPI0006977328|nr:PREDICTED: zinc finger protein 839 isoform X2 [Chinchilla lanigera]
MTQTLFQKEDPLNLGGGWSSSAPLGTWSSCRRRRRGAPIYKQRYSQGRKSGYEPPRKKPKQQHAPRPWFQPPRRPCWYPNWGSCAGPWHPPPAGFRKPPCPVEMMQVYGLHPLCACCCSCWCAPWNPGWVRRPGRKKRWGRWGRWGPWGPWGRRGRLRRPPRSSFRRSPPVDLSMLLRPVNLYGWRAPGMRAPRNTTQFIMNQIYQDMRQQEKEERRQRAQRAQQARAGSSGDDAPPSDGEENAELPETFYSYLQDPSLVLSPPPVQVKESPAPQLVEEEEAMQEIKGEEEEQQDPQVLFAAASCALRPRAFRCQACDKAYIGPGGLARHWKLNPGHGRLQSAALPEKGHTEAGTGGLAPWKLCTPEPSTPAAPGRDRAEAAQGGLQCAEDEEAMVLEPENTGHSAAGLQCGDAEGPAGCRAAVAPWSRTTQLSACRSRARLQESLQQCGQEDLVELALPRLAQVLTVYEFLLEKAKDSGAAQPRFPAVYREFEELHGRVKSMCQEHLGHAGPASQEPLEVSDPQVAQSLGITGFLRRTEAHPDCAASRCHSAEGPGQRPAEASGWLGACEATQQVPEAQRAWRAALPRGGPECPAAHGGGLQSPRLCVPTAGGGFAPPASGPTPPPSEGSHGMTVSSGDASVSHAGGQLKASADLEARHGSAGPAVLGGDSRGAALCAQLGEAQETVPDTRPAQGSSGVCSALSPMGEAAGAEPGNLGARPTSPLPEMLPVDIVPVGCAHKTGADGSPLTIGSHASDLNQLLQGRKAHSGLGDLQRVTAVGDAVAFEITNGCPEGLPQEQIFVQTASGVLLSPTETTGSQENIILVTGVGSPGLHIGDPEGMPLVVAGTTLAVQAEPSQ